ncbi:metallophosphatase [Bacteroidales bacterium OttesenSCG-928-M11]|nr:metallophosphatase [Bacteroidales bacterium OttesenSCG-928-M11]
MKLMRNWTIGLLLILSSIGLQAQDIVVLHVNDTHSRIEPTPESDPKFPNRGGMARINAIIEDVRSKNNIVFFFHCGDFVQGTPYFNVFKGKAEVDILNFMKLDAATIGNHEFDYGLNTLKDIVQQANFPFITTNLDFSQTALAGMTHKYILWVKEGIRIGVVGLSPEPEGLVAKVNYEGMKYLDPIVSANETADFLREEKDCDLIICLSHLGYFEKEEEMGDITLAKQTRNIDIILGGHTHTYLEEPVYIKNKDGKTVTISQVGERGLSVGRLDIKMEETN